MDRVGIHKIELPLIIPRRGRGHTEVVSTCSVSGNMTDPYSALKYVYDKSHHTMVLADCVKLTEDIRKHCTDGSAQVDMRFKIPIERIDTSMGTGYLGALVGYTASASKSFSKGLLFVRVVGPIANVLGKIDVYVTIDKSFFEDVYDAIHKALEFEALVGMRESDKIDPGKTAVESLHLLKARFRKMGSGYGRVRIDFSNPTEIYQITHTTEWGKASSSFTFEEVHNV